jgi:hypothetical protein
MVHFQHVIFTIDFTGHLQVCVFKTPRGMVLAPTLHQLSSLAIISFTAADDVSTFLFNFFKDVVYQLCATQVFKFVMTPKSTGCIRNVVQEDIMYGNGEPSPPDIEHAWLRNA